ncbi:uncharacterized protein [Amphiura filiformis]|uniref:uncharacterized protein n=1 Tax=Amphiura filiformis TaxID=82378 RepID=UPI003B2226AC
MTKFCSKKVLIICLCFTTILASLLIGKNLYQGTPTFQNAFTNKLSDDGDAGEMHQGGRRQIQDNENHLRLDIIRHGGFANDGTNIVQGETGELVPRQEIDENDDSSEASFPKATKNKEMLDDLAKITKQDEALRIIPPNNNGPVQKWTLESDPRVPRILAKIMSSMPKEVRQDIPQEYLQMGPRKYLGTRFKVVSDAYKKHGMTQRLPEVISIGVKKSGTNAVGFFVTQHPQIVHSVGNEVHFFDRNYQKGLEYYRIRMGFAKEDQFCFEKTPKYFVTPNAPKQILSDLPKNIKFVLSVRDPVKRALSDFRHERELYVRRKWEEI